MLIRVVVPWGTAALWLTTHHPSIQVVFKEDLASRLAYRAYLPDALLGSGIGQRTGNPPRECIDLRTPGCKGGFQYSMWDFAAAYDGLEQRP